MLQADFEVFSEWYKLGSINQPSTMWWEIAYIGKYNEQWLLSRQQEQMAAEWERFPAYPDTEPDWKLDSVWRLNNEFKLSEAEVEWWNTNGWNLVAGTRYLALETFKELFVS